MIGPERTPALSHLRAAFGQLAIVPGGIATCFARSPPGENVHTATALPSCCQGARIAREALGFLLQRALLVIRRNLENAILPHRFRPARNRRHQGAIGVRLQRASTRHDLVRGQSRAQYAVLSSLQFWKSTACLAATMMFAPVQTVWYGRPRTKGRSEVTKMSDVFISYARDELPWAEKIKSALHEFGLEVFFDLDGGIHAGDAFPERITQAVRSSKVVVACWSPLALQRPWVRRECLMARDLGKLVPLAVQRLAPRDLPAEFYDVSFVELHDFDGSQPHLGWSQALASIAARFEAWATEHAADATSTKVLTVAEGLRRQSLEIRRQIALAAPPTLSSSTDADTTPRSTTAEQWSGATKIWKSLKDSWSSKEIDTFIESFPGTPEAYEARRRLERVKKAEDRLKGGSPINANTIEDFLREFPDHPSAEELKSKLPKAKFAGEWAIGGAALAGIATWNIIGDTSSGGNLFFISAMAATAGAFLGWLVGSIAFSFRKQS
jgi:hypothetical protein